MVTQSSWVQFPVGSHVVHTSCLLNTMVMAVISLVGD